MKVKTVSYQKTFPLAQYVNEKIEIVVELQEGDDVQEALGKAKATAEKFHRDSNPQLYGTDIRKDSPAPKEEVPNLVTKPETLEEVKWRTRMEAITNVDELVKWVNKCPKHIYLSRMEELSK
jgi:hypothetical protein